MLTEKKKRFCNYYIIYLEATKAAEEAGYTYKRRNQLNAKASHLLKDKDCRQYIAELLKKKNDELMIKQDEILHYLSSCIKGKETEKQYLITRQGNKEHFEDTVVEKDVPVKARDRIKASELMAKYYNLMDGESTGKPSVIINANIPKKSKEPEEVIVVQEKK